MKLSLDDQIIDSQSLTLAILASLIFGESIGFVGGAGFVLGVMGLLLLEPFVDAVVTKCKHYFCEHCALKHHAKNKKCFVCNKPTLGIFNTAHEIRKRIAAEGK